MCGGAMPNRTGRILRRNEMGLHTDEFVIRPLTREGAPVLAVLESRCVGAANWGEAALRAVGTNGIIGWVAAHETALLGFILVRAVADEMEIMNLAVDPDARRKGIAARLLEHGIAEATRADVKRVYLEVRESNSGARAFYLSRGFVEQGRRKNYYANPAEDALLLVLRLH
jgi:[ribosomal protein S18]-alanine N-acetyltransferase